MALQLLALTVFVLVLLPAYIIYKPPKAVISRLQSHNPSVLFQIQTKKKIVALTIDDAPSPYTKEILDILSENDVTATFFVIGNQAHGNEAVLADIVRAGHELGNHAMHDEPSVSLSSETLTQEIHEVDIIINAVNVQATISALALESSRKGFWTSPRKLAIRRYWGAFTHTILSSHGGG
jgi:peptidoglycan/xylan/chitin deacetylase (PgdA/CDA1 family)